MAGVEIRENFTSFAENYPKTVRANVIRNASRMTEVVAGFIREEVQRFTSEGGQSTGRLARSFKPSIVKTETGGIKFGVYSTLPYARIHDTGGTIRAKRKRHLHFKVKGKWVKTKRVRIKRKHYLKRAGVKSQKKLNLAVRATTIDATKNTPKRFRTRTH